MEWYIYVLVIVVGVAVGIINTIAGSGSLLSLPLLIFLGLDAGMANGTNRVAILMQSITAVGTFKQHRVFTWHESFRFSVPAVLGSIAGALLAVNINTVYLEYTIGGLLIVMFFILLVKPEAWIHDQAGLAQGKPGFWQVVIFVAIGFYGGFIQAGVGFFLLAGLVLGAGLNLVKANAIKVVIVLFYTPFALIVFVLANQIDYKLGLILGVGSMLGAYIGAKLSIKKGAPFIRYFLLVSLFISALKLFGLF